MKLVAGLMVFAILVLGCSQETPTVMRVDDYKAAAEASVSAVSVVESRRYLHDANVVFVDVREGDEVEEFGRIDGSVHLPRGVLEFYIDPGSSMHMDIFSSGKRLVFYCETGGRSLLAAKLAKDMGVVDPVYLDGGFRAWSSAGDQ